MPLLTALPTTHDNAPHASPSKSSSHHNFSKLTVATWNINSIRIRTEIVLNWLERHPECDFLALQEIKCEEDKFPSCFEEAGYYVALTGQKSYNGVAFISRHPLEITHYSLPNFEDSAARYIETRLHHALLGEVFLGNLYLPNGNSGGEEGYQKKLNFFEALFQHAQTLLLENKEFIFMGDYNLCPTEEDYAPKTLSQNDALIRDESRAAFRKLLWLGLTDAFRALYPQNPQNVPFYTFFDYTGGAFQRNAGLRIDHALLSPAFADHLTHVSIEREERAKERPSDHVPVIFSFG